MAYKVLVYFEDLQDHRHPYHAGDLFPRAGYAPSAKRIAELCGTNNKRGAAVIEPVKTERQEETFPENASSEVVEVTTPNEQEESITISEKPARKSRKKKDT